MKQKNFQTYLYSTVGVVAMVIVLLAFYVISSAFKQRIDLTAEKAYTLSPGTRQILGKLDKRVTIRFYCTQGENAMPVQLKTYASRVEDLLGEYKQAAHGKIAIEKYDPIPDSDAEDSARLNGVEGQPTSAFGGDKVYLGLVVSVLNEKVAIPWLAPDRERLLEYDLSRAIARVVNPTPPVLGIMSPLPVFGAPANPMMMRRNQRGAEPWVFVSELKKDFTVRDVPMSTTRIDDDIKVLIIIHPRDISDAAQYAIDQFILRGGRVLAMVDPHAYFDQKQDQMAQVMGQSSGQSSLDKLFKAWGIEMDINKVAADLEFGIRNRGGMMPAVLGINRKGINEDDIVTSQIDNVVMPFAGVFTGKPVDGLKETVLLRTTSNSQLVEAMLASMGGEQIVKDFKPSNNNYALAIRLAGKFKTAFPDGKPQEKKDDKSKDAQDADKKADDSGKQLKESTGEGIVILVGDSDLINDQVCVQVQDVLGYKVVNMPNGNLNFVQSLIEQLSGDSNLITLRSRASMNRPFTRVRNMEAAAEQKYQARIKELEGSLADTQRKLQELQSNKQDAQQRFILSPEQQKEVEKFRATEASAKKDLKELRKNLRKDTDSLEFRTKVINIAAMPVLVAITGVVLAVLKRKKTAAK
jgi:ABC-type uncharacterized transport system involved in gliding motility auxiliary subunit